MENPADRIRGILDAEMMGGCRWSLGHRLFLCGFDRLSVSALTFTTHGIFDQFTQNGCAWLPLTALGLKPGVSLRADIDYDFRHTDAVVCPGSVPLVHTVIRSC